jgi:transcription antitermination factor NusG
MPVLASEPAQFPDDLFGGASPGTSSGRAWWVMHTKPRQEKSLARQLLVGQIPFYLPLIGKRYRLRARTIKSFVPLFAGYLFVFADNEERIRVLSTHRVVRNLQVVNQEQLWSDLRQIHQLIAAGAPITPVDKLVPGTVAEIRSGPLAGLRGKIIRTMSGGRFVVEVDFIQRGASVLLEDFNLQHVADA